MPTPVKTLFMGAVYNALLGITSIQDVKRGQGLAADKETAVYPFSSFFTESVGKKPRNRVQFNTFTLIVHTVIQKNESTVQEQGDLLDADIESALLNDADVRTYSHNIEPVSSDLFYNEDESEGLLESIFNVTLAHVYKNPYQYAKNP
jgi:hypothetical protein